MRAALVVLLLALWAPTRAAAGLDCHQAGTTAVQQEVRQAFRLARDKTSLSAKVAQCPCALWPLGAVTAKSNPGEAARHLQRYRELPGSVEAPRWLAVDTRHVVDLASAFYQAHEHYDLAIAVLEAQRRALEAQRLEGGARPAADRQTERLSWYLAILYLQQGPLARAAQEIHRYEALGDEAPPPWGPWGGWGRDRLELLRTDLRDATIAAAGRLRRSGKHRDALQLVQSVLRQSASPYLRWHLSILSLEAGDYPAARQAAGDYRAQTHGDKPPPSLKDPGDAWGYQTLGQITRAVDGADPRPPAPTPPRSRGLLITGGVLLGLGVSATVSGGIVYGFDGWRAVDSPSGMVLDGHSIGAWVMGTGAAAVGLGLSLGLVHLLREPRRARLTALR